MSDRRRFMRSGDMRAVRQPRFEPATTQRVVPQLVGAALLALLMLAVFACFALVPPLRAYQPHSLPTEAASTQLELAGFYPVEQLGGQAVRWTSGYAFAQLPYAYHAAPSYIASVTLRAEHPQGPRPLTFRANEQPLASITPTSSFRTYHVLVSRAAVADPALRFALQTESFTPAINPRELGVIVTDLRMRALPTIDWAAAAATMAGVAALWLVLLLRGQRAITSTALCAGILVMFVLVRLLYRPGPLPFAALALLALGGGVAAAFIASDGPRRLALAVLAIVACFSGALWPSWMTDDALISFRYAQNLVLGNGLVYNVGERVEGYTNFLWTMLAALVLRLGGDPLFWSYVGGIVLAIGLLLATYALARRLIGETWASLAALLVGTSQAVLLYSARGSGLETPLFALLVLLAVGLCARGPALNTPQALWGGLVLALATMTRPEGALVCGVSLLYLACLPLRDGWSWPLLVAASRRWLPLLGSYLAIFVPYFLWRASYYGDLLPNTFYAKTGGGLSHLVSGLSYTGKFALGMGGPLLLLGLVPLQRGRAALIGWQGYMTLLVGMYTLYIISVGGDHFPGERFFVPLVPLIALLVADGAALLYGQVASPPRARHAPHVLTAIAVIGFSVWALGRSAQFDQIAGGNDESLRIWREYGWWIADHTTPDASVAALGAGAIAYDGQRTTIDLLGLTDKHIARVEIDPADNATVGHEKRDPAYVLNERQPTYIPKLWDFYFGGEAALRDQYTLIIEPSRFGRALEIWKRQP